VALVVLAAGGGTRMKSALPKPLHPVAGLPMVSHVLRAGLAAHPSTITLVVSPQTTSIVDALDGDVTVQTVVQDPPRGTGDAARLALACAGDARWMAVLFADHPLLTAEAVDRLVAGARESRALVTFLTCWLPDAASYGRIERDHQQRPVRIVERKDDDPVKRTGRTEINSGMAVLDLDWAREALASLQPSPVSGEIYLTDLMALAVQHGPLVNGAWPVATVDGDPEIAVGINDRVQLAAADTIARDRIRRMHMQNGVTIVAPESVLIDDGVTIGQDTTIEPFSVIRRGSAIGRRCVVGPQAVLEGARLGDDVVVRSSTLTDASVADGSDVGPYAHLRGNTAIGPNVHIGNFAEINRSVVEERVKVGHVSYLGDAHIGAGTNIGAGAITCNFDGESKHRTEIGREAFIGSDSMLVAPLTIGDVARTGAGSVVTKDVPAGATVVGVPARAMTIRRARVAGEQSAPEKREDNAS
jgi:bifunctional UDP-N-acetylglucosamine pyrophosphorylase/glucosamine-1-phosphate N-acetyltransferase